jgi:hypothetical protein
MYATSAIDLGLLTSRSLARWKRQLRAMTFGLIPIQSRNLLMKCRRLQPISVAKSPMATCPDHIESSFHAQVSSRGILRGAVPISVPT